jgi:hypothetical protein
LIRASSEICDIFAPLAEKARKDFPHSPAGKACSKTVVFSGSGDAKTVKNQ